MKVLLTLIMMVMLSALIGCFFVTFDYYYLSLEGTPSIKIESRGVVLTKLDGDSRRIPKIYVLDRSEYSLQFLLEDENYSPHFKISVHDPEGSRLTFKQPVRIPPPYIDGFICANYIPDTQDISRVSFGWSSHCTADNIPKYISLDILNTEGEVLGSEYLAFILKKAGRFTVPEGI